MSEGPERANKFWTFEEEETLIHLHRKGWHISRIAVRLKRTQEACVMALQRLRRQGRFEDPWRDHLTTEEVCRILDVMVGTLDGWRRRGDIRAVPAGYSHQHWRYAKTEIYRFIREHWERIAPLAMPPGEFRRYACEQERKRKPTLSVKQVAAAYGVSDRTVTNAWRTGKITGEKRIHKDLYLDADSVRNWKPDLKKSRAVRVALARRKAA